MTSAPPRFATTSCQQHQTNFLSGDLDSHSIRMVDWPLAEGETS
jgi:hypothetical protein